MTGAPACARQKRGLATPCRPCRRRPDSGSPAVAVDEIEPALAGLHDDGAARIAAEADQLARVRPRRASRENRRDERAKQTAAEKREIIAVTTIGVPNRHQSIQRLDVVVMHADAAVRHVAADRARIVGAVNRELAVMERQRGDAHRVLRRAAGDDCGGPGLRHSTQAATTPARDICLRHAARPCQAQPDLPTPTGKRMARAASPSRSRAGARWSSQQWCPARSRENDTVSARANAVSNVHARMIAKNKAVRLTTIAAMNICPSPECVTAYYRARDAHGRA